MRELTCIVCPNGCSLNIEKGPDGYVVKGNRCPRGKAFALEEMEHPMRTICSTVRTIFPDVPVVSVRVSEAIPKEMIFPVMREINRVRLSERLKTGDVVIKNVLGLNSDIIITSNILINGNDQEK